MGVATRTTALALSAALAAAGSGAIGALAASPSSPSVTLGHTTLPSSVGKTVQIRGRLHRAPSGGTVALQRHGRRWRTVARATPRSNGRFTVSWPIPAGTSGPVSLRVALVRNRHVLTTSRTLTDHLAVLCASPSASALPGGEGAIVGGLYFSGGAAGAPEQCSPAAYTVVATDSTGATAAIQHVPGGASYRFVLPAGSYTLTAGQCIAGALVSAGQETHADVRCSASTQPLN